MMKIDKSSPVMITGATGYVAGPIVKELLDAGLTVHCPVRDPDNPDKLKHLTDAEAKSPGKLKFFKADLLTEGSYFEAMQTCSIVFHTASPFIQTVPKGKEMEMLVDPAVKGTANVLTSVAKTPSVKRVVLTSSCYAVLTDAADCALGKDGWATEEMWNSTASIAYMPYAYSKKAAEEEAWKIADAQSQYKLVVVNPGWVMGPGLKTHAGSESYQFVQMVGNGVMASGAPDFALFMVDVRDVATAHVRAAFTPEAEGRFILVGTNTSLLKMVGTIGANDKFKGYPLPTFGMPKLLVWLLAPYIGLTRTGIWRGVGWEAKVDNSKSKEILKMEYKPMATTMSDMFGQMVDTGMIDVPKKK